MSNWVSKSIDTKLGGLGRFLPYWKQHDSNGALIMDTTPLDLEHLFQQLGLPSDAKAIELFIRKHTITKGLLIHQAGFWTISQQHFLAEALAEDAQWSDLIDHLDTLLRK
ncbi:DUF2789 domain-containing protein [Shewanella sp. GutCb]|uniref:DUF2789 domain-containing protein n=1 Tax=Shewanella sp. GutCb TaxID=2058315 RepID=UPI0027E3C8C0|nr:DUF2789 domain-containing protein [Shewanella sp. GutCb]